LRCARQIKRLKLKNSVQYEQLQEQSDQLEETRAVASGSRLNQKMEVLKSEMEGKLTAATDQANQAKRECDLLREKLQSEERQREESLLVVRQQHGMESERNQEVI